MAYDKKLETRLNQALLNTRHLDQRKMFGGVAYLKNGNMLCGIHGDYLILRLGVSGAAEALKKPHTRPFDITGKAMKGWIMVDPEGIESESILLDWLQQAKTFVATLPPK